MDEFRRKHQSFYRIAMGTQLQQLYLGTEVGVRAIGNPYRSRKWPDHSSFLVRKFISFTFLIQSQSCFSSKEWNRWEEGDNWLHRNFTRDKRHSIHYSGYVRPLIWGLIGKRERIKGGDVFDGFRAKYHTTHIKYVIVKCMYTSKCVQVQ